MSRIEPDPPRDIAGLLVFGSQVSDGLLEELSVQFELFLESVDRGLGSDDLPHYRWELVDPTFRGRRVLMKPVASKAVSGRSGARPVRLILSEARQGIALIGGSPRRPPSFNQASLDHLTSIAEVAERPGVSRLAFYANRESEPITTGTLANLRRLGKR